jgi:hypothetical protein
MGTTFLDAQLKQSALRRLSSRQANFVLIAV